MDKACLIACVRFRALPADENAALQGHTLHEALCEDIARGLVPIFVSVVVTLKLYVSATVFIDPYSKLPLFSISIGLDL